MIEQLREKACPDLGHFGKSSPKLRPGDVTLFFFGIIM
ncbi:5-oxoprolinase subunit A [Frankliniella fusca]|uniref:5-oxoprolinase subunit A n=1 Tax=Frankliniella fusca TaxID=407009 RepID=A0AAE1GVG3_9NEOP|nr:5-oxoprolinase subunit A [Frankliniella fusca]